jgi:hypothetical protein
MSEQDQAFEAAVEKINAKLAEAATALEEATRLAREAGLPALIPAMWISEDFYSKENRKLYGDDMDDKWEEFSDKIRSVDVFRFESALSSAGWSASASYC